MQLGFHFSSGIHSCCGWRREHLSVWRITQLIAEAPSTGSAFSHVCTFDDGYCRISFQTLLWMGSCDIAAIRRIVVALVCARLSTVSSVE